MFQPFDRFLRHGTYSELYFEESKSLSLRWEDGHIEAMTDAVDSGVGLRILNHEQTRYAHLDAVEPWSPSPDLIAKLTGLHAPLIHDLPEVNRGPVKPLMKKAHPILKNPQLVSLDDKIALLKAADAAARISPLIKQVVLQYGEKWKTVALVNSDGSSFWEDRPYLVLSITVTAERDGEMQTAYEAMGGMRGYELFDGKAANAMARLIAERALQKLDAPKAPVGEMPILVHSSAGGTLIHEAVGHSLEADAVLEGTSPSYIGMTGKVVANEKVTVLDDPTVPMVRGSFFFDDEGTPSEKSVLIENGVLKTLMYDRKSAARAGRASNGHGRRESHAHRPIPRMSNTIIAPGKDDPARLLKEFQNGFLVTRMGGGQVNTANGDFVFDVEEGFKVENGKRTMVRGATLLGNGPQVLMDIEQVGSDLGWGIGTCGKEGQGVPVSDAVPTLRIKKLVIGGS